MATNPMQACRTRIWRFGRVDAVVCGCRPSGCELETLEHWSPRDTDKLPSVGCRLVPARPRVSVFCCNHTSLLTCKARLSFSGGVCEFRFVHLYGSYRSLTG